MASCLLADGICTSESMELCLAPDLRLETFVELHRNRFRGSDGIGWMGSLAGENWDREGHAFDETQLAHSYIPWKETPVGMVFRIIIIRIRRP